MTTFEPSPSSTSGIVLSPDQDLALLGRDVGRLRTFRHSDDDADVAWTHGHGLDVEVGHRSDVAPNGLDDLSSRFGV